MLVGQLADHAHQLLDLPGAAQVAVLDLDGLLALAGSPGQLLDGLMLDLIEFAA